MDHLLYLMFRCDFDVMENLEELEGSEHNHAMEKGGLDSKKKLRRTPKGKPGLDVVGPATVRRGAAAPYVQRSLAALPGSVVF